MGLLDFLFPKYCVNCRKLGSYLCPNCFAYLTFETGGVCGVCNRASADGFTHSSCIGRYTIDGIFTGIAYKGVAKKLIYRFKYKPYISDLKTLLGELFYESLIQNEGFSKVLEQQPVLVPIPLHSSKLKTRGYNHAEILAQELAKRFDLSLFNALLRVKKTSSQFGLDQEKRKENVTRAFALSSDKQEEISNKYVLLVDDILTTGATLSEAANVLKRSGFKKVWGLAFARD